MGIYKTTNKNIRDLSFYSGGNLKTAITLVACQPNVKVADVDCNYVYERDKDETAGLTKEWYIARYKLVEVVVSADAPTTIRIKYSFDNVKWFTYYESSSPETYVNKIFWTCSQRIKVEVDPAGSSGDKVSVYIGGKI